MDVWRNNRAIEELKSQLDGVQSEVSRISEHIVLLTTTLKSMKSYLDDKPEKSPKQSKKTKKKVKT